MVRTTLLSWTVALPPAAAAVMEGEYCSLKPVNCEEGATPKCILIVLMSNDREFVHIPADVALGPVMLKLSAGAKESMPLIGEPAPKGA